MTTANYMEKTRGAFRDDRVVMTMAVLGIVGMMGAYGAATTSTAGDIGSMAAYAMGADTQTAAQVGLATGAGFVAGAAIGGFAAAGPAGTVTALSMVGASGFAEAAA